VRLSRITRLARVEAQEPETAWQHTHGLAALLAYASSLPTRDPLDVPDPDEEPTGLGRLLKEAREWQQRRNGA
jgi:hypothetical protein